MSVSKKATSFMCVFIVTILQSNAFFKKENWLDAIRTNQKNYGVAVSDVNHDGKPDFIVAGYSGANFVFTYDDNSGQVSNIAQLGTPYEALRDVPGNAIGEFYLFSIYVHLMIL